MKISEVVINNIAQEIQTGMLCFYHKPTGEVESYPDELKNPGFEEEPWEDVMKKVDENYHEYIRVEGMSSSQGYRVMAGFIDRIEHIPTHDKFIDATSGKKPFAKFKELLFYYDGLPYRMVRL